MTMNPTGLREETSTPAPTGREREVMRDLLQELQGRIDLIPLDVLGFSTATVRDAFQRFHDRMAAKYGLAGTGDGDPELPIEDMTERLREFLLTLYVDASEAERRRILSLDLIGLRGLLYNVELDTFREMFQREDRATKEFLRDMIELYGVTFIEGDEWSGEDLALIFLGLEFSRNFCLDVNPNVGPPNEVGI